MLVGVPRGWLPLAPNRLKALPRNCASSHQIAKAQVGSLRGLGLGGGVMPESRCQRRPHPDLGYGQPEDGQTEHDGPDSEDAASNGVCFHGPTLAIHTQRVLIERNHSAIEGSDEGKTVAVAVPRGVMGAGSVSAGGNL